MAGLSKKTAQAYEIDLIASHGSNAPSRGYNNSAGGEGKNGFVPSEETREKIRGKLLGHQLSQDTKNKIAIAHKGKQLSDQHKMKLREVRKNMNGKPVICLATGVTYPSAVCATRETGVSRSGITACCRGEIASCRKTADGMPMVWRYVGEVPCYE